MKTKPIEQARDTDIRLSLVALRRAARRAQALARDSGLPLVISHNGLVEYAPLPPEPPLVLQDPSGPSGDKKP